MDFDQEPEDLPGMTCGGWEKISPEIDVLKASPSFYMMKVLHTWQKKVREELGNFDLTNTQFTLLTSLLIMTGEGRIVTQMDLANYLSADKMMVSQVVRTLEKKGYVVRKDHPEDRRAKMLAVTDMGIDAIDRAVKVAVKFDERFFSVIEDDREEFIRILKKLK